MPEIIKLADGSEREVPTQEEQEALVKQAEEVASKNEELQKQVEETQKNLSKLSNKDYNFRKLEELTEEQRSKLSEQEKALMQKAEELDEKQNALQKNMQDSWEAEAIAIFCGNDEETQKKVRINLDKVKYDNTTKDGIQEGIRNAYTLLGQEAQGNPLHSSGSSMGQPINRIPKQNSGGEEWSNKDVDKGLASNFGITNEDLDAYEKFPDKGSSKETGTKTGFQK